MKMEFSAGGVVYTKTTEGIKIALIKDSYGKWTFPKGHIEKKEKPEEAALREVSEEIGLTNLKIDTLITKTDYWFKFNQELIHKYVYFYLMQADELIELKPQEEEINDAKWVNLNELGETLDYKSDHELILEHIKEKLS